MALGNTKLIFLANISFLVAEIKFYPPKIRNLKNDKHYKGLEGRQIYGTELK
jgi:hypothetical protein